MAIAARLVLAASGVPGVADRGAEEIFENNRSAGSRGFDNTTERWEQT
jgi:hypothetical protein